MDKEEVGDDDNLDSVGVVKVSALCAHPPEIRFLLVVAVEFRILLHFLVDVDDDQRRSLLAIPMRHGVRDASGSCDNLSCPLEDGVGSPLQVVARIHDLSES